MMAEYVRWGKNARRLSEKKSLQRSQLKLTRIKLDYNIKMNFTETGSKDIISIDCVHDRLNGTLLVSLVLKLFIVTAVTNLQNKNMSVLIQWPRSLRRGP